MAVSIPEELRAFGITSKEFVEKKRGLAKSAETEVNDNDVIWEFFQDLTKKALSYETDSYTHLTLPTKRIV